MIRKKVLIFYIFSSVLLMLSVIFLLISKYKAQSSSLNKNIQEEVAKKINCGYCVEGVGCVRRRLSHKECSIWQEKAKGY